MKADFNQYTSSSFNKSAGVDFSMHMGDGVNPTLARICSKGRSVGVSVLYKGFGFSQVVRKVTNYRSLKVFTKY